LALIKFAKKKEIEKNLGKEVKDMSKQEIKELLMINTYKLALVRSQLEALSSILIKKKLATYEEIWKQTEDNLKDSSL
jgi:hypothetical protein